MTPPGAPLFVRLLFCATHATTILGIVDIIGPPSGALGRVAYNLAARTPHARFVDDMLPALWTAGLRYGVDPVVVVAQAGKETGWGHYGGNVPATYHNTCGLKIRDPSGLGDTGPAHAQFGSWDAGAHAHAQHLVAYAHGTLPVGLPLLDTRWVWVWGKGEPVTTVEGLGGRWAPSATYGQEVALLARTLAARG